MTYGNTADQFLSDYAEDIEKTKVVDSGMSQRQLRSRLQLTLKMLNIFYQEQLPNSPEVQLLNEEVAKIQQLLKQKGVTLSPEYLQNLLEYCKLHLSKYQK